MRSLADHHREVTETLQRSNDQLVRDAEDLIVLSRHDAVTGLPNRRVMGQILVDHFKVINDQWSHAVGDEQGGRNRVGGDTTLHERNVAWPEE